MEDLERGRDMGRETAPHAASENAEPGEDHSTVMLLL